MFVKVLLRICTPTAPVWMPSANPPSNIEFWIVTPTGLLRSGPEPAKSIRPSRPLGSMLLCVLLSNRMFAFFISEHDEQKLFSPEPPVYMYSDPVNLELRTVRSCVGDAMFALVIVNPSNVNHAAFAALSFLKFNANDAT